MIRKFECWSCKKTFEADDSSWVECPHCHLDNVEYASKKVPKPVKWSVPAMLAICAVGYGGYYIYNNIDKGGQATKEYGTEMSDIIAQKADSAFIEAGGKIEPSLSIAEIKYNEENNTYNCRFQVDYPPEKSWKVVVMSYRGKKVIAESENGVFEELPYSEYDGFYIVRLLDKETNNPIIDDKEFPDFEKQVIIKKGWTAAELEQRLNGKENLTDNDYLADKHKVVIVNKPAADTSPTSSLREVQDMLRMCKLHAKVLAVEYDEMKKINMAKLSINYPTGWMESDDDE